MAILGGTLESFPPSVFADIAEDGAVIDDSIILPETPAYELWEDIAKLVGRGSSEGWALRVDPQAQNKGQDAGDCAIP
jgi:hypothetical protein